MSEGEASGEFDLRPRAPSRVAEGSVTDEERVASPTAEIGPRRLSELMLVLPFRCGANLLTLVPGPLAASLVVKRGSLTLTEHAITQEVATAAAVRLAWLADFDLLSLPPTALADGTARRVKVRAGGDTGEMIVSFSAAPDGIAVEVRPLLVNGAPPEVRRSAQLCRCQTCGKIQLVTGPRCDADGGTLVEIVDDPRTGGFIGVYQIGEVLGEGGMGTVFAAEHALLSKRVAIKLLHRTMIEDPLAGRRFLAEAQAASAIRHPSVVEISDYGLLADGRPYIVMERLDGESLQERLDRTTYLPPISALLLAREIARALGGAHDRGVVHLDLKPSNVILLSDLDESPKIKLIDFGVAAYVGTTTDGGLSGTPQYMSPEQVRGWPADLRNDLYALGVVLYEMLSGEVPFESPNIWSVLRQHLIEEPPPVTSPAMQLPESVVRVVRRALSKNPDERHQSANEFVGDCEAALAVLNRKEWLKWLP